MAGAADVQATDAGRVTFLILRAMRRPILVLVAVYATSMAGWVLIPGAEGAPPMSLFHAFYFLTYTATTTGFGEIPYEFSDLQRMWSMASLYAGVVAWLYAVGSIIKLIQNPHFAQALAERRFAKRVARMREPFVIVCGFGNTGSLLTRGLSDAGITAVILDSEPDRVNALSLRDYRVTMYALRADARVPEHLIQAGLLRPNCRAVVAMTADEEVNYTIAVAARLLNPRARVITRSTSALHEELLVAVGGDVTIVDPFRTFARYLSATIHTPAIHALNHWLIGATPEGLADPPHLPAGTWILCGHGRMGGYIHEALDALNVPVVVIDPRSTPEEVPGGAVLTGRANRETLLKAGIDFAAGIVAGTNDDAENLNILLTAKALNPDIFLLVRQNQHRNEVLFNAAQGDLIMQPSLVTARRILFLLTAPLLRTFFEELRERGLAGDTQFLANTLRELRARVGEGRPRLWTADIDEQDAPAVVELARAGTGVSVGELLADASGREDRLPCVPLVLRSGDAITVMPDLDHEVAVGDQILFCGRTRAKLMLQATLNNAYTLRYLVTGVDEPRSVALRILRGRRPPPVPAAGE